MIENDVISIAPAEVLLLHLTEVKDRGVIGEAVWCEVALSVLRHVYFSDFTPLCHEVVRIGIEKSDCLARNGIGVKYHWINKANKYRSEFESIQNQFKV